jgi:hypothetical protein
MPFEDVSDGFPTIAGPIKIECLDIEDAPNEGMFGPQMRWSFRVWDDSGEITNGDGSPFVWYQYTSTKMSPTATAAIWAQALLGRPLDKGEAGIAIQKALVGRTANAFAETRISETTPGVKKEYSKISAISPAGQGALEPEEEEVTPF